jgi:outer membrane immunogenic protein
MKELMIAAGAMLAMSVLNASAADITPRRVAPPPPIQAPLPPPVFNWTGFYLGGNVGYGWSHRDFTNTITSTLGNSQNTVTNSGTDGGKGWLGGGQIGFNYQFLGNWVAGIEADIDAAHITSSTSACFTGAGPITSAVCGTRDTDIKDFGTVRGRLGYGLANVLLYGTGGWAWAHADNTTQITCLGPQCPGTSAVPVASPQPASVDVNLSGWAAGGGLEWAFLPNWTLRAEYLHLQFDRITEDRSIQGSVLPVFITTHVSSNVGVDLVRVGVNYLFH